MLRILHQIDRRQRLRWSVKPEVLFVVFLIVLSHIPLAQAQIHPWPIKEFSVDWEWNKDALEKDLGSAASFYETKGFLPPTLRKEDLTGHFWEGTKTVFFINSIVNPEATRVLAEYSAKIACECCQNTNLYVGTRHSPDKRPIVEVNLHLLPNQKPLEQKIAIPHELFHAVQYSYFSLLNTCNWDGGEQNWGVSVDEWFLEGMTEAMALEWAETRHNSVMKDKGRKMRTRGWRPYNISLDLSSGLRGGGMNAKPNNYGMPYRTSSFWRFLGSDLIRTMLEYDGVSGDLDALDWMDQVIKKEWIPICEKVFGIENVVPTPEGKISCERASEFAGLYLLYPMFITQFVESERDQGGLGEIFVGESSSSHDHYTNTRIDGCIVADPMLSKTLFITLHPVAAECVRIPSEHKDAFLAVAELKGKQDLEHLILGWNGCIQTTGQIVSYPDDELKMKVWSINRGMKTGINGCRQLEPTEDLLLVFSNVAPEASSTSTMKLELTLRQDSESARP